jgi:3-dehydro-L-gulonate 2-dehydrogenase
MPPWGAAEPRIGNNPLIVAIPRKAGHVVLDMALAQYSYGALTSYNKKGERLPYPGGFDQEGNLSRDPGAIAEAGRPLPIGYWKGSGLSIALDLMAALLSDGNPTRNIPFDSLLEVGLSQVFITLDISQRNDAEGMEAMADSIIEHLHASKPVVEHGEIRYPGEQTLKIRNENMRLGVPVDPEIWNEITGL